MHRQGSKTSRHPWLGFMKIQTKLLHFALKLRRFKFLGVGSWRVLRLCVKYLLYLSRRTVGDRTKTLEFFEISHA